MNFKPLRHAPGEIELGGSEAGTGCTHEVIADKFLHEPEEVVCNMDPLRHTCLEGSTPGVFLGGPNILSSQIAYSSSAVVNNPRLRDHSRTLITCSILNRRKEIESASGSVVALKRNVEKNSLAATTGTSC